MISTLTEPDLSVSAPAARRAFGIALGFLVVVALLGALLRWQMVRPLAGFAYGHWLHAHSHTAFLGFVFNAFFAISLARFVPPGEARLYMLLFIVLQVAVLGMLVTFPVQGYAPLSIAFSTLHMIGSGVFAWRLWHCNLARPAARGHLRAGLLFLVLSGLGPLALGPLAALGLRDTPAYQLCIYFYLHAQYNGWFLFFLQALALHQRRGSFVAPTNTKDSARALRWLVGGAVLTIAQSTLWLNPPGWVYLIAALGGAAQLVGFVYFLRALRGAYTSLVGPVRALLALASASLALKLLLQTAAAWPVLAALTNHRFVVIAFLHLIFLGVVTPAIFAWGLHAGWLRDTRATRLTLCAFFVPAAVSELFLVGSALGWTSFVSLPRALCATAALMALAALRLFFSLSHPSTPPRRHSQHAQTI